MPLPPPLFALLSLLVLAACQSGGIKMDVPSLSVAEARATADPRYAGIVVDVTSGEVLYAEDADSRRHPASLTKLMTLYILFEEMKAGRMSLATPIAVSAHAARMPASKLGLKPGQRISVKDAITAICVRSANDVAVAVAEAIAGSEPAFAQRMNREARALGLSATHFDNATGLPDRQQITSARDMALLARAAADRFPRELRLLRHEELHLERPQASKHQPAPRRASRRRRHEDRLYPHVGLQPRRLREARRHAHHRRGARREDRLGAETATSRR